MLSGRAGLAGTAFGVVCRHDVDRTCWPVSDGAAIAAARQPGASLFKHGRRAMGGVHTPPVAGPCRQAGRPVASPEGGERRRIPVSRTDERRAARAHKNPARIEAGRGHRKRDAYSAPPCADAEPFTPTDAPPCTEFVAPSSASPAFAFAPPATSPAVDTAPCAWLLPCPRRASRAISSSGRPMRRHPSRCPLPSRPHASHRQPRRRLPAPRRRPSCRRRSARRQRRCPRPNPSLPHSRRRQPARPRRHRAAASEPARRHLRNPGHRSGPSAKAAEVAIAVSAAPTRIVRIVFMVILPKDVVAAGRLRAACRMPCRDVRQVELM